MTTQKPTLGESMGSLVASLVDATLSHCEALKGGTIAGKGTQPGAIAGKGTQPGAKAGKVNPGGPVPDTSGETTWAIGLRLGCAPGSTGVPGETMVKLSVPTSDANGVTVAACKMTPVPPGMAVPSSSYPATAPSHAAPGLNTLRVSIDPALPRGLYLGVLRTASASGAGGPHCPVVIFLDGLP